jgi:hypothetical protein
MSDAGEHNGAEGEAQSQQVFAINGIFENLPNL